MFGELINWEAGQGWSHEDFVRSIVSYFKDTSRLKVYKIVRIGPKAALARPALASVWETLQLSRCLIPGYAALKVMIHSVSICSLFY